jgi:hypothetical protein
MSLAIKWGYDSYDSPTQGFIYFDAVTSFSESNSGSVSSHPIDGGGTISDHFTRDNAKFTFSGVISGVDISYHARLVEDDIGNEPPDSTDTPSAVVINSKKNPLLKFIPDAVGQFFTPSKPSINTLVQAPETLEKIREDLRNGFSDPSPVQLFIYDLGNLRTKPIDNLIMTSITFKEDPESGDALYCDVNLEQVTFVYTYKTQIPLNIQKALVAQDIKDKADATADKGAQDSTEKPEEDDNRTDLKALLGYHGKK